jgi:hypothetical protein
MSEPEMAKMPELPRMDTPGFWDTESMSAFYAEGVRAGMERAAQIAEDRPLRSRMDEWDSTAEAIREAAKQVKEQE